MLLKAKIARAYLNVTGANVANSTSTILHVYGILNDSWTETGINWNNAPDLAGASDAKLANVNSDAFPVGQLTWNNTAHEWGIDVTDFVRSLDLIAEVGDEDRVTLAHQQQSARAGKAGEIANVGETRDEECINVRCR